MPESISKTAGSAKGSPKPSRNRILLTSLCSTIGAILLWRHFQNAPTLALLAFTSLLLALSIFAPKAYYPIFRGLDAVIQLLLKAFTWFILGLIYFLIFTPVRFVLILMGKDVLLAKIQLSRSSYWTPIDARSNQAAQFKRQY